jgi:hypothetical protein
MKKIKLTSSFLLYSIIIPLVGLILYCLLFRFLSAKFIQVEGVTYIFIGRLLKLSLLVLAVLIVAFVVFCLVKKIKLGDIKFTYAIQRFDFKELALLLLPLAPIAQYLVMNSDTLSFLDDVIILSFFLLIAILFVLIIPMFAGRTDTAEVLKFLGLALIFITYYMSIMSQSFAWYAKGSMKIQLLVFGGVFLLGYLMSRFKMKTILLALVAILFLVNVSSLLFSRLNTQKSSEQLLQQNELLQFVQGKEPVATPNVYLLVYDAYVNPETIAAYGIDNSAQMTYLESNGFVLYPHTYSVGATSLDSMSRVLNVSDEFYGDKRRAASGDGVVQNIFLENGYKTYGLFPTNYFFRGIGSNYDVSIPTVKTATYQEIIPAILVGEFRFDFQFNQVSHEEYVTEKDAALSNVASNSFIYMHTNVPSHSQNSGACLANEEEQYAQRLEEANKEMQADLSIILAKDPQAIIIIAGDHGPYLTKNCVELNLAYDISEVSRLDVQDRYGSFLAIRWPDARYQEYDDITVLQDLFPAIFAYMYDDGQILDFKIKPIITDSYIVSGVSVKNGIIIGGIDDGQPLYVSSR